MHTADDEDEDILCRSCGYFSLKPCWVRGLVSSEIICPHCEMHYKYNYQKESLKKIKK